MQIGIGGFFLLGTGAACFFLGPLLGSRLLNFVFPSLDIAHVSLAVQLTPRLALIGRSALAPPLSHPSAGFDWLPCPCPASSLAGFDWLQCPYPASVLFFGWP